MIRGNWEIKRLAGAHDLPEHIKTHSIELYNQIIGDFKHHYIELLAQMCVYYHCEYYSYPIEMERIIRVEKTSPKLARKYYQEIIGKNNLKLKKKSAAMYIPLCMAKLELPSEIESFALKLVSVYEAKTPCHGNSFKGIAAGCIYFACKLHDIPRSQTEISSKLEISELTLRSRYKELETIYKKMH